MLLTDLVAPSAIIPALKVNSKKQILQELAAKASELSGQSERTVLEILQQREKLGSTGVGNGIAIPHGKLPKLGDRLEFIIPHCDPTVNLYDQLYVMRGDKVEDVWRTAARRE